MTTPTLDALSLSDLAARVRGAVLEPSHADYAAECSPFHLEVVPNPAVVVIATCAEDIEEAVRFAAANGMPIAVQATGHGIVTPYDGAVLVITRRMNGVQIDPEAKRARVEPGVIWAEVTAKAVEHGLVPLSGSTPTVGAVGYLLGGGLPILGRKFGFAADHVRSIDIVTPDGELRTASPEQNQDLFWALRGGKGNFGIVTSIEFDLFDLPEFYGGALLFPGPRMGEILPAYAKWLETIPEEMCTSIGIFRLPPLETIPEPMRGQFLVSIRVGWVGDVASGEQVLAPMRALGPVMDMVGPMPWTESGMIHMDPQDPVPAKEHSLTLNALDEAAIASLMAAAGPETDCSLLLVEIRLLGGALAREPQSPNAISHRGTPFNLFAVTITMPELEAKNAADFDRLFGAMSAHSTGGAFVNFLSALDVSNGTVKRAYDEERYARLCGLKQQYDPQNLFRTHHTIG